MHRATRDFNAGIKQSRICARIKLGARCRVLNEENMSGISEKREYQHAQVSM